MIPICFFIRPSMAGCILVAVMSALVLNVTLANQEEFYYNNYLHENPGGLEGKNVRDVDEIGGGNLLRDLSMLRNRAAYFARKQRNNGEEGADAAYSAILGESKRAGNDFLRFLNQKRNMDEMDRSGFSSFIKKRNFDEMDRAGFDSFVKRNFDEMDRAGFGSFVKRDLRNQEMANLSDNANPEGIPASGGVRSQG